MQFHRKVATLATSALLVAAPAVFAQAGGKDVVAVLTAAGNYKTFLSLVADAGMTKTLQGAGPFTVFAPNDAAFAALPAATLADLKGNKDRLTALLKFHVVPGTVMAADFKARQDAQQYAAFKTSAGSDLKVHMARHVGKDFANLVQADMVASNGVAHGVDKVLMP